MDAQRRERFSRQTILPEVGQAGQEKLAAARVLLVGAGGLGSPAALYLAAAGVGCLGIADGDKVELSNLHRQVLHSEGMIGLKKAVSARRRLTSIDPDIEVVMFEERLTSKNALAIVEQFDIVVDGSDNFPTRYLLNDACVLAKKPNVFGAVQGFAGQVALFDVAGGGPCYRCLFPEPPPPGAVPSCAEAGVLGVVPGVIGLLQANEVLKHILGYGTPLRGTLLCVDLATNVQRSVPVPRDPTCPICGPSPTITELIDYEHFCNGGSEAMSDYQVITAAELADKIRNGEKFHLIDVRNADENAAGSIPGATLIPLPELSDRVGEIEALKSEPIVIHCAKGGRSARACEYLASVGFTNLTNVAGGYDAFAVLPPS